MSLKTLTPPSSTNQRPRQTLRAGVFSIASFLVVLLALVSLQAQQAKAPYDEEKLLRIIQLNGLSTTELVQYIQQRGVSFQMTPAVEAQLRQAGARPEVIAAARANYRRGNAISAGNNRSPNGRSNSPRAASYEDLTDEAIALIKSNNPDGAINALQKATALNAAQPTAYQLLGFVQLYGKRNIMAAEQNMRAAIERGGAAVFRVYHDHANGLFTSTCDGSLFVTKSNVTFKADNGQDTFEASNADIGEIKTNGLVGRNYGAFHIKVEGGRNYNFAPLTKRKEESNLITMLANGGKK